MNFSMGQSTDETLMSKSPLEKELLRLLTWDSDPEYVFVNNSCKNFSRNYSRPPYAANVKALLAPSRWLAYGGRE